MQSFLVQIKHFLAYDVWSLQDFENNEYNKILDYWFGVGAYIALRFSETMNPIFYNLGSPKIRAHTKEFFRSKLKMKFVKAESVSKTTGSDRGTSFTHGSAAQQKTVQETAT